MTAGGDVVEIALELFFSILPFDDTMTIIITQMIFY